MILVNILPTNSKDEETIGTFKISSALLILKVPIVSSSFEFVGKIFTKIISFTQDGTMFLFRSFETGSIESPLMNFVVMILPTVIFFSAEKKITVGNIITTKFISGDSIDPVSNDLKRNIVPS